ncbi:hypothetical protein AJ80_02013 [Polytolypa hystricis UAMH7299]|uniref:Uncharacterized protein n=1 Tax=Polytolypa hystricis (strain UAMH7299) TaxID=1447883 RepID=A0A2B7YSC7_POLH7|nr:hypothetical protein AJ80_02013 [Polytolypa hystricis UAMH7299]
MGTLQNMSQCPFAQISTVPQPSCPAQAHTVSEDVLREISRGALRNFVLKTDDINGVVHVWQCLLKTFSSASISSLHKTATCNATSSFFDATFLSKNQALREFGMSEPTWIATFEAYLDRYEDSKPKPMRQVLTSLIKALMAQKQATAVHSLHVSIVRLLVPNIILCEPRSRLKASIASLEWLVRKDAFPAVYLIRMIELWLAENTQAWYPLLEKHCIELGIPFNRFKQESTGSDISSRDLRFYTAQIFALAVLNSAQNKSAHPHVGSFFSLLCQKLKQASSDPEVVYFSPLTSRPFWVEPLKYVALNNLDDLDSFSNYMFSPLFKDDRSGSKQFLQRLPLQVLEPGRIPNAATDEFLLLFSVLQVAKETGLVQEDSIYNPPSTKSKEDDVYILHGGFLGAFLVHPDSTVRISALSLLTTTLSTTKPLPSSALQVLQDKLSYLHAEADPHSRDLVLVLIRKLLTRIRGGLSLLRRRVLNEDKPTQGNNANAALALSPEEATHAVNDHLQFLRWYIDFLESELRPSASYQRHISALRGLTLVLQSGLDERIDPALLSRLGNEQTPWSYNLEIFRPSLFRVTADLLTDPFDDVRATSLAVLNLFPNSFLREFSVEGAEETTIFKESSPHTQLVQALSRAEQVASRTSRADHADAVARLYHILFDIADADEADDKTKSWYFHKHSIVQALLSKLEKSVQSTGKAFQLAMRETPLHGYLSSLRYIVESKDFYTLLSSEADQISTWRLIHERIVGLCEAIWIGVSEPLCIDSPEGQYEESTEEMVGPKDLLSCSWRALRESSLLLNAILLNMTYAPQSPSDGLNYQDFARMGKLCFTQLAELRHRGAFSAVSQTFLSCSERCGQSEAPNIVKLPEAWYEDVLRIIDDQAAKLTRRSAGLPALITGIVSSNPSGPLFQRVVHELQSISRTPAPVDVKQPSLKLPQVHALNCLKDIFMNTRLGPSTEPYIMSTLVISVECLGSKIWAIRNCGLMLYRALMSRMCRRNRGGASPGFGGVSGSEPGRRVSFDKYPTLTELLSSLLKGPVAYADQKQPDGGSQGWDLSITTERVFPALALIGEKVPYAEEDNNLRKLVSRQFRSPVWGVREHAARIYASLLRVEDILSAVMELSDRSQSVVGQNEIHGILLCMRYALQRLWASPRGLYHDNFEAALRVIEGVSRALLDRSLPQLVEATLFEILNDATEAGLKCGEEVLVLELFNTLDHNRTIINRLEALVPSTTPDSPPSRSSSLFLRAVALLSITSFFLSCAIPTEGLSEGILGISNTDTDAGSYLLEHLYERLRPREQWCSQRIKLYISIVEGEFPYRVKRQAIDNLSDELEALLDKAPQIPADFDFLTAWARSPKLPEQTPGGKIWDRDMVNVSMRLRGCLLALQLLSVDDFAPSPPFVVEMNKWIQGLRFAAQDETEFDTRFAAALSLKSFFTGLKMSNKRSQLQPLLLSLYLVLYDLVNDDDEEIRDVAAEAASRILSCNVDDPNQAVALLPLAASSNIINFLINSYRASSTLFTTALTRLVGQKVSASNPGFTPVSEILAQLRKESTVLFVEEKQNLFIDDVREAEIWATVLTKLSLPDDSSNTISQFHGWVLDGLSALLETSREEGKDEVFGWTSNVDVLTTGVRAIRGARVLLRGDSFAKFGLDKESLRRVVGELRDNACLAGIHSLWVSELQMV